MTLSSSNSQSPNRPGELHLSLFQNISAKRAHHRSSVSFVTDVTDLCVHGAEVRKEAGGLWGKRMNFSGWNIGLHTYLPFNILWAGVSCSASMSQVFLVKIWTVSMLSQSIVMSKKGFCSDYCIHYFNVMWHHCYGSSASEERGEQSTKWREYLSWVSTGLIFHCKAEVKLEELPEIQLSLCSLWQIIPELKYWILSSNCSSQKLISNNII